MTTTNHHSADALKQTELDACKFCGKTSTVRLARESEDDDFDQSNPDSFAVVCDASSEYGVGPGGCGASGGYRETSDDAIAAWNRRSTPAVSADLVELRMRMEVLADDGFAHIRITIAEARALLDRIERAESAAGAVPEGWAVDRKPSGVIVIQKINDEGLVIGCVVSQDDKEFAAATLWEFVTDLLATAPKAPIGAPTVAAGGAKPMTRESNDELLALARRWKLDGDWMTCKGCKRSLIASRDGEELNHADGCKFSDQHHPWTKLRDIITGRATSQVEADPAKGSAPAPTINQKLFQALLRPQLPTFERK